MERRMYHLLHMFLIEYTLQIVLLGGIILGATAGILGAFVFVRQQSLLSDAIAHASLPGIIIMFLCTGSRYQSVLICGGIIAGGTGIILMHMILYYTKLKRDAVLGIILSVFFGIGLILLTIVQKQQLSGQQILNKYLFGNITTLLYSDLWSMGLLCFIVLVGLFLINKENVLLAFDAEYTQVQGYSVNALESLFHFFLTITIGIGLHMVGVILISTMIISPAIAARQCTYRMPQFIVLSGVYGALSSVGGIIISSTVAHLPTGPCIVLCSSGISFLSLLIAYFIKK